MHFTQTQLTLIPTRIIIVRRTTIIFNPPKLSPIAFERLMSKTAFDLGVRPLFSIDLLKKHFNILDHIKSTGTFKVFPVRDVGHIGFIVGHESEIYSRGTSFNARYRVLYPTVGVIHSTEERLVAELYPADITQGKQKESLLNRVEIQTLSNGYGAQTAITYVNGGVIDKDVQLYEATPAAIARIFTKISPELNNLHYAAIYAARNMLYTLFANDAAMLYDVGGLKNEGEATAKAIKNENFVFYKFQKCAHMYGATLGIDSRQTIKLCTDLYNNKIEGLSKETECFDGYTMSDYELFRLLASNMTSFQLLELQKLVDDAYGAAIKWAAATKQTHFAEKHSLTQSINDYKTAWNNKAFAINKYLCYIFRE